jgi:xylitol oxidase
MKKREFLKLSSALITAAAIAPLESCEQRPSRYNWAGNIRYLSDKLYEPTTLDELKALVQNNSRIKGQGTNHSFNGIDNSTFGFIRVTKMNQVISLDETNMTVTVQAGMRYGELCKYLEARGYALHNLASLPHISIGGSVATATHGSGDKNGNLSTAVRGMKIMNAAGEIIDAGEDLNSIIVHLGALGIVTEITLAIQPTFQVRQYVFQYLPMSDLKAHFDEIFSSGYSVSLFTDWSKDTINQVWVKKRVTAEDPAEAPAELFGARAATKDLHPIETISAVNCTPQLGVAGPWHERLPHFKLDFTPSAGEELQAEYFVPRANAYEAIAAVYELREKVNPLIQISEVRSIAADNLLMSPCRNQDSIAIHFTWKKDWDGVKAVLPLIEKALSPFRVRPHWGKLFTLEPATLQKRYQGLNEFRSLMKRFDPNGKFVNEFLERNLG